jgi:hypothetical protein
MTGVPTDSLKTVFTLSFIPVCNVILLVLFKQHLPPIPKNLRKASAMTMTIRALYDRPRFNGQREVILTRTAAVALVSSLDDTDASLIILDDSQFGYCALGITPAAKPRRVKT